nr:thiamine pyrophosphate-dependent enzyme [Allopusillimonas soli]
MQHSVYGAGDYQSSSELHEMKYADIANSMGCLGLGVEDPEKLGDAFEQGLSNKTGPTVLDIVVMRNPARMLLRRITVS